MNGPSRIPLLAMLVIALLLTGCGGQDGGGGGGGDGDLPERASASSEDPEGTTYPLAQGRYRLSFRAPACQQFVISIRQLDGDFVYEQQPRGYVSFINDLPAGEYTVVAGSECEEWTIELSQF